MKLQETIKYNSILRLGTQVDAHREMKPNHFNGNRKIIPIPWPGILLEWQRKVRISSSPGKKPTAQKSEQGKHPHELHIQGDTKQSIK